MVRISRKDDILDILYTKEAIVGATTVDDEDNLEREVTEKLGSEATVMEIDDFRNECVRRK